MHILITGASGFVGRYIVEAALAAGHDVTCLARHEPRNGGALAGCGFHRGDVTDPDSLSGGFDGVDAVIHLVGIIQEKPSAGVTFERIHTLGTEHVVRAAREAGVSTFIQMSANGARENGVSRYQTSKWMAEGIVRRADFDRWTIFRPTLVFGKPGPGCPEFGSQLLSDLLRPLPLWPVFGDGTYAMQPIHVTDLAHAFVEALSNPSAANRLYHAAGTEKVAYNDILKRLADGAGLKQKPLVHVPIPIVSPVVRMFGGWLLPISIDQFNMLTEGNTCDASTFLSDFGIDPIPFDAAHLSYLAD